MYRDRPDYPYILIQYVGEENVYKERPHGNRVKDNVPHSRTCPSVLHEARKRCSENKKDNVHKVYEVLTTKNDVHTVHQAVLTPRNEEQVKNISKNV